MNLDLLASPVVRGFAWTVQRVPIPVSFAFAWILGRLAHAVDLKRRAIAYANLKAAFPGRLLPYKIKSIIRKHYLHLSQNLVEIFYFPRMNRAYMDQYIEVKGQENYDRVVRDRVGTMLMTAHFGNWELSQICSGILGNPMRVLAHEQKQGRLDAFLNELRASHGSKPVLTEGMGLRDLIRTLQDGELVGVLGDQGGGRDGLVVNLFGRRTTVPTGVMEIAARTQATVIPCFAVRRRGPFHTIYLEKPFIPESSGNAEENEATHVSKFLKHLEEYVMRHPEQWLWGFKRWKFCFTKRVLVLEDENTGHRVQAQAIASEIKALEVELGPKYEFLVESVPVKFKNRAARFLFFAVAPFLIPFVQGRLGWLKWFLKPETADQLCGAFADLVVSCGSSLTPLGLWLARENLAKTIHIMKPPFPYDLYRYDLIVLPKHDHAALLRSKRVATTVAPNLVNEQLLESSLRALKAHLSPNGRPKISIFIGGTAKHYEFNRDAFKHWMESLKQMAEKLNVDFVLTTSRRTADWVSSMLKEAFQHHPRCRLLVIANEKNIEQVAYGMLAASSAAVVTADSVSMISEAVSAGKSVIILELGNGKLAPKHRHFHRVLIEEGLAQMATPSDFEAKVRAINCSSTGLHFIQNERKQIRESIRSLL